VFGSARSDLELVKSSEASSQAKAEEARALLQAKDQELEALKAKLADLERYISLHHTSVQSLLYALAWLSTCMCYGHTAIV
jgi:hypothetical protein